MVKKIVFGILMAGLCGVLIVGAVNRTTDRTTGVGQVSRQGDRYASTETISDAGERSRGAQGNSGINRGEAQGLHSDLEADPIFTQEGGFLQGIVVGVEKDILMVELSAGEEIVVTGRAWSFAQEQGFAPRVNDQVKLAGDVEGEEFEVWRIENLATGQIIVLRDGKGSPQWAGRGKRGG
ncbi:MAG: hypothetical protein AMJ88_05860 [Anaerolineae bacterium SM23_ 63]|nr:MAG: hypothetical protein AMJ88_05860 [Anaerolineae bacterium SM23_ 63]HEY47729.1 hypothetical protein [Anaerolineae bacterium]